jgi:hypothetical protein
MDFEPSHKQVDMSRQNVDLYEQINELNRDKKKQSIIILTQQILLDEIRSSFMSYIKWRYHLGRFKNE